MMWREFSRESPCRPGLAIVSAAAALAGATALAWAVSSGRVAGAFQTSRQQLEGWPIDFRLPTGFALRRWYTTVDEGPPQRLGGVAEYADADGSLRIAVRYKRIDAGRDLYAVAKSLFGEPPLLGDAVDMGEARWALGSTLSLQESNATALTQRDDLAVAVSVHLGGPRRDAFDALRRVCGTMRFHQD